VLLPEEYIEMLRNELNDIGVLTVGNYNNVVSYSVVKGYWRPLEPFIMVLKEKFLLGLNAKSNSDV